MTHPISKEKILKEITSNKVIPPIYSEFTRKWCQQMKMNSPSHVVLYLDEAYKKLFVAIAPKPPHVYGFVMDLNNITAPPTDVKQYTMQTTKEQQMYIMADKTKFVMAGFFKAPVVVPKPIVSGIRPSSREIYHSIASTEVVNEETGVKFHVNVEVRRENEKEEAIVAFYDSRYFTERNNVGQFIADYYVSTIRNHDYGLTLDGGVDDWYVTHRNMRQIHDWLATEF